MRKVRKNRSKRDKLMDKAWRVFSRYIRERDKYICFTCGSEGNHAGHFKHGKHTERYFNEHNVHCQCVRCNMYLSGNQAVYLRRIQQKYGMKKADELLKENKMKKWKVAELEELIDYYQKALDKIK